MSLSRILQDNIKKGHRQLLKELRNNVQQLIWIKLVWVVRRKIREDIRTATARSQKHTWFYNTNYYVCFNNSNYLSTLLQKFTAKMCKKNWFHKNKCWRNSLKENDHWLINTTDLVASLSSICPKIFLLLSKNQKLHLHL